MKCAASVAKDTPREGRVFNKVKDSSLTLL